MEFKSTPSDLRGWPFITILGFKVKAHIKTKTEEENKHRSKVRNQATHKRLE